MRKKWMAAGLALVVAGCSGILGTDCTPETRIIEVDYGSWAEKYQREAVSTAEADGWDCYSESIRNAFGGIVGTKYTCTRCA